MKWALVLGGSSGLGWATVKKLAKHGYAICVAHRDRRADLEKIEKNFEELRLQGATIHTFNADALNPSKRNEVLTEIQGILGQQKINVLIHSIAKGNLKPMSSTNANRLSSQDLQLTIDAMAISLYDWVSALVEAQFFASDSRVISFTSEGNTKAWHNYAAVSAAKAALEALTRNIALEYASVGIKANCIQAGVTDTKSFRMIPGSDQLKSASLERNPNKRLTTPEDVANAAYLLTLEEAKWITGTILKVDGGESLR